MVYTVGPGNQKFYIAAEARRRAAAGRATSKGDCDQKILA